MAKILDDAAMNGSSMPADWTGGTGTFWAWGTFDGAIVELEASPDGDVWFLVGPAACIAEKCVAAFSLGACKLRATVSNAGEETLISVIV
jgi:hypothetical protein